MRLYTAVLNDGDYNRAINVSDIAKLLIPFAAIGLTEGLFRLLMNKPDTEKKKVFTAGFLLFGGGFALLVPLLLVAYFILSRENSSYAPYMAVIGIYIFCSCLHSFATQYIRTKDHFAFFSLQGVINTGLVALFNILFCLMDRFGVNEYVLSVALADILVFLLVFVREKLWRDLISPHKIEKGVYREMLRYSAPLIPMAVSWWITSASDKLMIPLFVENGNIADFYAAAYKIPTLVTLLCMVFSQAWSYSSVAEEDEKERSSFFSGVFSFYFGLLFFMASLIIAFSKVVTGVIMAPAYYPSWQYIPLLTGATVFCSLVTFVGSVYTVRLKSVLSMVTSVVGAVLNIILNLLLIPDTLFGVRMAGWGAFGAAIATLVSYGAVFLIRALTAGHYVHFKMQPLLLLANCGVMLGQLTVMTFSDRLPAYVWIPAQVLAVGVTTMINGKIIYKKIKEVLRKKSTGTKGK